MIVVVGLSHRTAPIEVRERLAFDPSDLSALLRDLVSREPVGEAMIVSTCNRVEIVAAGRGARADDLASVARIAAARLTVGAPDISGHLYTHLGPSAVRHLFRVAASLDSLVLGEPQILGQVKEAFDLARDTKTLGPVLHRVVPRAIRSAKRARTETSIGAGQVSVPGVAAELATQIFGDFRGRTAALIGSGEMGEAVLRLFRQAGANLVVVGRNAERVNALCGAMGAQGRPMSGLVETLVEADVVVSTTSAHHFVVDHERVRSLRRVRKGRNLFFIDLAVPRDIDPAVGELDGVFLYNIDDLSRVVAESLQSRQREAERAESIVAEEAAGYDRWADTQQVTPTVVALRHRLRSVLLSEIERSLAGKLKHFEAAERDALEKMAEAALNKILHGPTSKLRALAADNASREELDQCLVFLHDLFELEAAIAPARAVAPTAERTEMSGEDCPAPLEDSAEPAIANGRGAR